MTDPRQTCVHDSFKAGVNVVRLTGENDVVDGFVAEVDVRCTECGLAFEFAGVNTVGLSHSEPAVSADGKQLRAPIRPPATLPTLI